MPKVNVMNAQTLLRPLFALGQVVMTQGINSMLNSANHDELTSLLTKHSNGNWGVMESEDWTANDKAINSGQRLMSVYTFNGSTIWIITEADRSVTTILLPSEY